MFDPELRKAHLVISRQVTPDNRVGGDVGDARYPRGGEYSIGLGALVQCDRLPVLCEAENDVWRTGKLEPGMLVPSKLRVP